MLEQTVEPGLAWLRGILQPTSGASLDDQQAALQALAHSGNDLALKILERIDPQIPDYLRVEYEWSLEECRLLNCSPKVDSIVDELACWRDMPRPDTDPEVLEVQLEELVEQLDDRRIVVVFHPDEPLARRVAVLCAFEQRLGDVRFQGCGRYYVDAFCEPTQEGWSISA